MRLASSIYEYVRLKVLLREDSPPCLKPIAKFVVYKIFSTPKNYDKVALIKDKHWNV